MTNSHIDPEHRFSDSASIEIEHRFSGPASIETESMRIIREELAASGMTIPSEHEPVVLRCIHASADFDYASTLVFSKNAVSSALEALYDHAVVVTDTMMAQAGINKPALSKLGCSVACFVGDEEVVREARERGVTRATVAVEHAVARFRSAIFVVGNAPTALMTLSNAIDGGYRPRLVIGVPVGFVNVVESKEQLISVAGKTSVPYIVARGRKGGSTIAAAIVNALLYQATDTLDPIRR